MSEYMKCPYDGQPFMLIPGYVDGYGCPACHAIGSFHLPIEAHDIKYLIDQIISLRAALAECQANRDELAQSLRAFTEGGKP